jgi:chorismate-pyruvate lyase
MNTATYPDILYPLSFMRTARGLPKLNYEQVDASELPEPYQSLLVHEGDMTSRLEAFHESKQRVKAIRSSNSGKKYFREVILESKETQKATEYGAIEIQLDALPEEVREKIVEAKQPLGGILNEYRIPYSSSPRGFLRVVPDGPIVEAFSAVESDFLYGRSNQITGFNQEVIARIVEILPT